MKEEICKGKLAKRGMLRKIRVSNLKEFFGFKLPLQVKATFHRLKKSYAQPYKGII